MNLPFKTYPDIYFWDNKYSQEYTELVLVGFKYRCSESYYNSIAINDFFILRRHYQSDMPYGHQFTVAVYDLEGTHVAYVSQDYVPRAWGLTKFPRLCHVKKVLFTAVIGMVVTEEKFNPVSMIVKQKEPFYFFASNTNNFGYFNPNRYDDEDEAKEEMNKNIELHKLASLLTLGRQETPLAGRFFYNREDCLWYFEDNLHRAKTEIDILESDNLEYPNPIDMFRNVVDSFDAEIIGYDEFNCDLPNGRFQSMDFKFRVKVPNEYLFFKKLKN